MIGRRRGGAISARVVEMERWRLARPGPHRQHVPAVTGYVPGVLTTSVTLSTPSMTRPSPTPAPSVQRAFPGLGPEAHPAGWAARGDEA